ncbi:hypothetical protein NQZ68_021720 [Dissostichus eleginoides]|nr:hypothetical protein NQZ68_021720 [Dissostichus eleginoides]
MTRYTSGPSSWISASRGRPSQLAVHLGSGCQGDSEMEGHEAAGLLPQMMGLADIHVGSKKLRTLASGTNCSPRVSFIRRRHEGDRSGRDIFKMEYLGKSSTFTARETRSSSQETSMKPDHKPDVEFL